jgi:uncharacterized protein (TIGR00297 family)
MYNIMHLSQQDLLISLVTLSIIAAGLSYFAVYKKWLTPMGAAAASMMAFVFYFTGGYKAFIAPGIFFITGSLLSRLNQDKKEKEGRNAKQVFANGLTGAVFMILYRLTEQNIYLITAIISFSISMADTASSEVGIYFKGPTYDILSFKKMAPGLSGGISLPGTLAGLAGAIFLPAIAGCFYQFSIAFIFLIAGAGFTGMLTDSLLGSWLQCKYRSADGIITEDALPGAQLIKGLSWCTNDTVNILSNILITLLFFGIFAQIQ